jgi:hypothetical protein
VSTPPSTPLDAPLITGCRKETTMPNWVYNNVIITATPERCEEIKKSLHHRDEEGHEQVLSFQNIVPRPAEETDWYNWNISHWDTKWDARDPYMEDAGNGVLRYAFSTAWSPPLAVLEAFVTKHDDVDIEYDYQEEQGWGGNLTVHKGTLIKHEEYDIPHSHEEIVKRQGNCYCDNGEQPYFDDCFYQLAKERGVTDPHVLEAVKGLGSGWSGTIEELIEAAKHL